MGDAYWKRLTDATPGLRDENAKMTISVAAFRKAIERAWNDGCEGGKQFMRDLDKLNGKNDEPDYMDILRNLGRKRS